MNSRDFCFWLQGYFEIHGNRPVAEPDSLYGLNDEQVMMIRRHLDLVFKHEIDPSMGDKKHQEALNNLHKKTDDFNKKHITDSNHAAITGVLRC